MDISLKSTFIYENDVLKIIILHISDSDALFHFSIINFTIVGEYPPQIHIKPALDVQKMENIQTCLDFLEHYGVSVNGITADGEKDINPFNPRIILIFHLLPCKKLVWICIYPSGPI